MKTWLSLSLYIYLFDQLPSLNQFSISAATSFLVRMSSSPQLGFWNSCQTTPCLELSVPCWIGTIILVYPHMWMPSSAYFRSDSFHLCMEAFLILLRSDFPRWIALVLTLLCGFCLLTLATSPEAEHTPHPFWARIPHASLPAPWILTSSCFCWLPMSQAWVPSLFFLETDPPYQMRLFWEVILKNTELGLSSPSWLLPQSHGHLPHAALPIRAGHPSSRVTPLPLRYWLLTITVLLPFLEMTSSPHLSSDSLCHAPLPGHLYQCSWLWPLTPGYLLTIYTKTLLGVDALVTILGLWPCMPGYAFT